MKTQTVITAMCTDCSAPLGHVVGRAEGIIIVGGVFGPSLDPTLAAPTTASLGALVPRPDKGIIGRGTDFEVAHDRKREHYWIVREEDQQETTQLGNAFKEKV